MMEYSDFLETKKTKDIPTGHTPCNLNKHLRDFQEAQTRWALMRGRAALWDDCGLGKSLMQLAWAHDVHVKTGGDILILAPLAVSEQTCREGDKFGIKVHLCRDQSEVGSGINITNYEMLSHFDAGKFTGVVLDESSILKNYSGSVRNQLIDTFKETPYRLACTATPAPNDYMEIGSHAEFLGVMSRSEMLAMFFVHDSGETAKWRLKGHAEDEFWKWLCSWAMMVRKPSDIGFSDEGYILPEIELIHHVVETNKPSEGMLFAVEAKTLNDRRGARKATIDERVALAASIANNSNGSSV